MQLLYFRLNNQLKLLKGLFNNIMIKDIQLNVWLCPMKVFSTWKLL